MNPTPNLLLLFVGLSMVAFGFIYNAIIAIITKKIWEEGVWQLAEGTTAFQVVGGVFVTLLGLAVLDHYIEIENNAFRYALILFACSGFPMTAGSLWRYIKLIWGYIQRKQAGQ